MEVAYFAAGCFWCVEAQYQRVKGVITVENGFMGGDIENPTYKDVKAGTTNHFQVVKLQFDPSIISFKSLLDIFFVIHDPTQANGQGEDLGTQYLSGVFYVNQTQKQLVGEKIQTLIEQEGLRIITTVKEAQNFYRAQDYHQNYWNEKGKENAYCSIIPGKIAKMKKYFKELTVEC